MMSGVLQGVKDLGKDSESANRMMAFSLGVGFVITAVLLILVLIAPVHANTLMGTMDVDSLFYQNTQPNGYATGTYLYGPNTTSYYHITGGSDYWGMLCREIYYAKNGSFAYNGGLTDCQNIMGSSFDILTSNNGYVKGIYVNDQNKYIIWTTWSTPLNTVPDASFTASVTSGYRPLTVSFTDTTTNTPTSWSWNFGDGNTSTSQNPSHDYVTSGSFIVNLTASNAAGSDKSSDTTITVNNYEVPVASMTFNVTNGSVPLSVLFTDTSTHSPTSYTTQIYDASHYLITTNTSQNFVYTFTSAGTYSIVHSATNPAGSDYVDYNNVLNINGPSATPTPTPTIPWPNQTGICLGSYISLGSTTTKAYQRYYSVMNPNGDTYAGYYPAGSAAVVSGAPFFTGRTGQYIYNEYNLTIDGFTGSLEYRSSYVVTDCVTDTPTQVVPTTAPSPLITVIPVPVIPTPTVSAGPTSTWAVPVTPVTLVTIPATITMGPTVNITDIRSDIDPTFYPFLDLTDRLLGLIFTWVWNILTLVLSPINTILGYGVYTIGSFTMMIHAFNDTLQFISYVITNVVATFPNKFINTITLCLWLDIIEQLWMMKSSRV